MSHHEEDSGHAGHAHPAPGIPEVKDEAGDSPAWLPKLGLGLGLALAALIAFTIMQAEKSAPDEAPAADEKTEAAKAE
jgi:hypothetical protein